MPTSKSKFTSLMAQLQATFSRSEMTSDQVAVYFAYLKEIPEMSLEAAVHKIIETKVSPYFPTIAEIKLQAEKGTKEEIKLGAMEAWQRAERCLLSGNHSDPILNEVIKAAFGGWRGFGMTDPDNDFDRHRFTEAYQIIMSDRERVESIKRLSSEGKLALPGGE
jgi:hypothetical protein